MSYKNVHKNILQPAAVYQWNHTVVQVARRRRRANVNNTTVSVEKEDTVGNTVGFEDYYYVKQLKLSVLGL